MTPSSAHGQPIAVKLSKYSKLFIKMAKLIFMLTLSQRLSWSYAVENNQMALNAVPAVSIEYKEQSQKRQKLKNLEILRDLTVQEHC